MTRRRKYSFAALTLFILNALFPLMLHATSTGQIHGKITDESSGERLIGVSVLIVGTNKGAATDVDGKFIIKGLPAGSYTLKISSVGYTPKSITNVEVFPPIPVDLNLSLSPESFNIAEVVIAAEELHSTESAILSQRKRSSTINDGISSEQIKRSPDATSGDALKRITGLSLVDNKFVFIRGITDRYNSAKLDGASLTSTEVGKKSFSFDLVPANLIEHVSVIKTATPDLPGDFSGGLVQLNTLDFPSKQSIKFNLGLSYNNITSEKDILLSKGGSRDWFASDDGFRDYPGDYPDPNDIARHANNTWGSRSMSAPYNGSFSFAYGDHFELDSDDANSGQLGFISALSYRHSYQSNEKLIHDIQQARFNTGTSFEHSILWGALANLSYKFSGLHKISVKNNFNRAGEDGLDRFNSQDTAASLLNQYTIMSWTERSTYTGQLIGDHTLPALGGSSFQWRAAVSSSRRDDPDRKEATYYHDLYDETLPFQVAVNKRSWAYLNERSYSFGGDVTIPFASAKLKVGSFAETKRENYRIRYFSITPDYFGGIPDSMTMLPLDVIYSQENFGSGKFQFKESSSPNDSYQGEQELFAAYMMTDLPFEIASNKFRFVGGARIENNTQNVYVPRTYEHDGPVMNASKHNGDILPSLNLTYLFNDKINLRFAYSHSVNRPEMRELSTTAMYDFVKQEMVGGNPDLGRALVRNQDVRVEFYPNIGELVAMSYFRKNITDAIEQVYHNGPVRERRPENSPSAINHGWEFEIRKSLDFIGGFTSNFSITGNYTRIFSDVELSVVDPYSNSSNTQYITVHRPMQGQSPYTINLSLMFAEPVLGTSVNLLFNKFGSRIDAVGFKGLPDTYEEARETVDLSVSQSFNNFVEGKFTVKNLTNKDRFFTRGFDVYELASVGKTYSLSFSLSL